MQNFSLWWEGTGFMRKNNFKTNPLSKAVLNVNINVNSMISVKEKQNIKTKVWDLVNKYSEIKPLLRSTAYILRFLHKILLKIKSPRLNSSKLFSSNWFKLNYDDNQLNVGITVDEINRSRLTWTFLTQHIYFAKDIKLLSKSDKLINSDLLKLDPFIKDNLLRVGGRLQNSLLDYDEKHPLILSYNSKFSKLLVQYYHVRNLQGGIKLTLSSLRQTFWIIKGRSLVKSLINKCHSCLRYRASQSYQKMGVLPTYRVTKPDKPFRLTGVDYAGPYSILKYRGRGAKTIKGYIVIFICLNTKAVHLELVSGYSSDDFLAAFRRFTSTRGPCSRLYSDQGTTFVGANSELKELYYIDDVRAHSCCCTEFNTHARRISCNQQL